MRPVRRCGLARGARGRRASRPPGSCRWPAVRPWALLSPSLSFRLGDVELGSPPRRAEDSTPPAASTPCRPRPRHQRGRHFSPCPESLGWRGPVSPTLEGLACGRPCDRPVGSVPLPPLFCRLSSAAAHESATFADSRGGTAPHQPGLGQNPHSSEPTWPLRCHLPGLSLTTHHHLSPSPGLLSLPSLIPQPPSGAPTLPGLGHWVSMPPSPPGHHPGGDSETFLPGVQGSPCSGPKPLQRLKGQ